jgi:hypothetical protein
MQNLRVNIKERRQWGSTLQNTEGYIQTRQRKTLVDIRIKPPMLNQMAAFGTRRWP